MGTMKIGYRNYIYQIVTSKSVNSLLLGNNQSSFDMKRKFKAKILIKLKF